MTDILYSRKEKTFFYACAYLGALFASTIILWWSVLVGGNPLTFKSAHIVNNEGREVAALHVGEAAGIRRFVCSKQPVGVEFFPTLRDSAGLLYPLPSGMIEAHKGCAFRTYGFVVPDIPPGDYVYQSTIRFQANLVGRDEMSASPEVKLRIVK
jgi:hypothetical protein